FSTTNENESDLDFELFTPERYLWIHSTGYNYYRGSHFQTSDNQELSDWLDSLRMALKLDNKLVSWKIKSLIEFNAYNKQRTKLDSAIDARIERLNSLLPTFEPDGACSKFYLKQRDALKNAKQLNNFDKSNILNENSKDCRDEPVYDYY
ncbi:hypothetical protein M5D96_007673, partial [Drosophila gunungcola]